MEQDELLEIFHKHLDNTSQVQQSELELVKEVVAEYMFRLMNRGNIPQPFLDAVESDLTEEVLEIYRKKTYGSYSLAEFRKKK